jgi:hypothetical protein
MRKLFIISLLLLEIGCDNTIPSDLTLLNGYWEIDYITHKNETFDPKGASRLLDFYEIGEKTGVRKKVQPQLNNKFLVTDDINTFDIILQNKTYVLSYKTVWDQWQEKIVKLNENQLVLEHQEKRYHYKRFDTED